MSATIFQASDLAKERRKVLDAARSGRALVRDSDGTGLVMLREQEFSVLESFAKWSRELERLRLLLDGEPVTSVAAYGEFGWLRNFDQDDKLTFVSELHDALLVALADLDTAGIDELISDWRVTARQLEDPTRRSVLLNEQHAEDFIEVEAP